MKPAAPVTRRRPCVTDAGGERGDSRGGGHGAGVGIRPRKASRQGARGRSGQRAVSTTMRPRTRPATIDGGVGEVAEADRLDHRGGAAAGQQPLERRHASRLRARGSHRVDPSTRTPRSSSGRTLSATSLPPALPQPRPRRRGGAVRSPRRAPRRRRMIAPAQRAVPSGPRPPAISPRPITRAAPREVR